MSVRFCLFKRSTLILGILFLCFSCELPKDIDHSVEFNLKEIPKKTFNGRVYDQALDRKNEVVLQGRVVKVTDGDTIDLLVDGKAVRIRLSHIDAPEKRNGQPYWKASKNRLGALCEGKEIIVKGQNELDRYQRFLGELFTLDGVNLNQIMVAEGLAWHYEAYSDEDLYAELQKQAQINKKGLWREPNPLAPWEWRKLKKDEIQAMNL